jgi:hypothetical protein
MCCGVLSPVVTTTGRRSEDQAGCNAAKRNPANRCQHREADPLVNSPTEDESRHRGNRQSGEGLVADVLAHIPVPRRAIG